MPLTSDQEAAADAIQEKYLSRLRSLNRSVEGLRVYGRPYYRPTYGGPVYVPFGYSGY